MKLRKRTVITVVVLTLIGFIGYSIYRSSTAPKQVTTAIIKKGNLQVIVSASGKVQSQNTAELKFTGTGRISYLPFQEGDYVTKGQVLAYLDGTVVNTQVEKAQSDYLVAIENLRQFDKDKKDKPMDEQYRIDRAKLEAQRSSAQALLNQAKAGYQDKTLISPIDGIISTITASVGETPTSEPVITVIDDKSSEFVAEVDEQDIGTITPGLPAEVFLDAYNGQTLHGTVSKIETIAKTGSTGNTYYPVKIAVPTSNVMLLIGMGGDVDIKTAERTKVTLVPFDAINEDEENQFVYVVENNKLAKRNIKLGLESDNDAEVISGLQEGDQVVTSDTSDLTEGATVVTKGN